MKQALRTVKIDQNGIEQCSPLGDCLFDRVPFPRVNGERDRIHWPGILTAIRKVADVVRDALGLDQLPAGLCSTAELIKAHAAEFNERLSPVTARKTGRHEGFVPIAFLGEILQLIFA